MASDMPQASEKLVFDTKGDVLLIFTRRSEDEETGKGSPIKSSIPKRKSPHDASNTITILISSRHMALASPVFDAMLAHEKFKEGFELKTSPKVEITLPDDDPIAFEILASVIHHRNKSIPKSVSFKLLTNLAALTEKYLMHEALHIVSQLWVDNVSTDHSSLPSGQADLRKICPSIFISWVFGNQHGFNICTEFAILHSKENFGSDFTDQYLLPTSIITEIKNARIKAFDEVFSALNNAFVQRTGPHSLCDVADEHCDFLTMGSLIQNAADNGFWPFPREPHIGKTVSELFCGISKFDIDTICRDGRCPNRVNFEETTLRGITNIQSQIRGLSVENFPRESNTQYHIHGTLHWS
ncbi:hypothetical protein EYC80_006975 [Monilinia laxa]|uniref:BTB domain-containing protein n=1 Tax=Monilinia laxa TaxID=61186 RepID=A0A5N6JZS8_MONLA|nr:hypothetical protein EYC80_006975 [Monilinia laxa]